MYVGTQIPIAKLGMLSMFNKSYVQLHNSQK